MTSAVEAHEDELSAQMDYVPGARGHAVLAVGRDESGSDALAIWRLGVTGQAVGAWVLGLDLLDERNSYFQRLMELLRDRCLVVWSSDTSAGVLDKLAGHMPARLSAAMRRNVLVLADLLEEVAEHRALIAAAAEEYRQTAKSKVAPLVWPTEIPDYSELMSRAVGVQRSAASPVAASALALTTGLAQIVQLWHDTEQVRYRRPHLRSFGDPRPLPPRWLARLRAAVEGAEQRKAA
ncbi:DUF6218 family protein [Micromonospora sp. NPDC005299]|uniref:DUF6218 family protein n=1 Tax=Micromonospora sp. NPDC005299 TaxID=3364231 RepID=UPI003693C1B4